MNIFISNASNQPIYEQIYTQLKNAIISGEIPEGEALPSIRALAKDLRISVITTKRAYDELERDGYIYTVAGKGCYAAPKDAGLIREDHLRQIEECAVKISRLASPIGLGISEILDIVRLTIEEEYKNERH